VTQPVTLHVERRGDGPALCLLAWSGFDHQIMAAAFEPILADTSWRRLYVDLPGTGGSPIVGTSSDAVLESLLATLDAECPGEQVVLMGCSYGAYLAHGALRELGDRVRGIVSICAGPFLRREERNLTGVLASTSESGWLDGVDPAWRDHFHLAIGRQTRRVADAMAELFTSRGRVDENYLAALRTGDYCLSNERAAFVFSGPASILCGRHDRIAGFHDAFDQLAQFPHASYHLIDGAGHYLPFEEPTIFGDIVRQFLDELARTSVD